jgi:uncharacterized protein YcbX
LRRLASISVAPVKGFRLLHPDEVMLTPEGVVENRRFLLVDAQGTRLRSSLTPWPIGIVGRYDAVREHLWMRFPDGLEVDGSALELGETVMPSIKSDRQIQARIVEGPWTSPLSALAGHPVRLARPERPGATLVEPVTLVSEASVERLAEEAGRAVDGRRFRMLFTLAGCDAHEEDTWNGQRLRVGDAMVRVGGPVDRCAVTTRDPDTGERDLDTLRLIAGYRGKSAGEGQPSPTDFEPLGTRIYFGVYAAVERVGLVRTGDPVEPL